MQRESAVRNPSIENDRFAPTSKAAPCFAAATMLTALSIDFVAKPSEARRAKATIPEAVNNTMKGVGGYAGCLVMVSDQEARLITVITFWIGEDRSKRCGENQRWLSKLIAPYVEGCLRMRTFSAHRTEILEIDGDGGTSDVHATVPCYGAQPNVQFAA